MADITHIFGGPWVAPEPIEKRVDPPEVQLRDAMASAGLEPPDTIHMDGKVHRFPTNGKRGDDAGWYVVFGDGHPAGRFGCWRDGVEVSWKAETGKDISAAEQMAIARRVAEAREIRQREQQKRKEAAEQTADSIWAAATMASEEQPYLVRKQVLPHGARVTGDGRLVLPMYNANGELSSLQFIADDSGKRFLSGGATKDAFWWLGDNAGASTVYLAEGFATAATIHEVTGSPCYIAYSAGNLPGVAKMMRERLGNQVELVVVADHDESGTGYARSQEAAGAAGGRVVMPPEPGDANDYHLAGHDLLALLAPEEEDDWLVPADEFCQQPAPLQWLVKRWLPRQSLVMVHGPSGGGKTFVLIDWMMRIATAADKWHDNPVKPGAVVYLAGEGHHGLRGRLAAWKQHYGQTPSRLWVSSSGCDLNTPEGYQKVVQSVGAVMRKTGEPPAAICVDTLHRFLAGDENSAQDAKTMLDACGKLIQEFGCAVVLVHHTGVSDEAQHRARGSSAWRGALDMEISVVPGGDGKPIKLVQRKAKDSEEAPDAFVDLQTVELPGWYDEDGEQVTSAVAVPSVAPAEAATNGKVSEHFRKFEAAWFAAQADVTPDGQPYLSSSALRHWLEENTSSTPSTIKQMLKPSENRKLVGALIEGGIISPHSHGWVVSDPAYSASLLMRRGG